MLNDGADPCLRFPLGGEENAHGFLEGKLESAAVTPRGKGEWHQY